MRCKITQKWRNKRTKRWKWSIGSSVPSLLLLLVDVLYFGALHVKLHLQRVEAHLQKRYVLQFRSRCPQFFLSRFRLAFGLFILLFDRLKQAVCACKVALSLRQGHVLIQF